MKLYTIKQAAEILKIKPDTLAHRIHREIGKKTKKYKTAIKLGRDWVIFESDLIKSKNHKL